MDNVEWFLKLPLYYDFKKSNKCGNYYSVNKMLAIVPKESIIYI